MAETIFDVLGTPFKVTDMNFPVPIGTPEFANMFSQMRVDLSRSDADCLFFFAKFPAAAKDAKGNDVFRYGTIECKSRAIVAMVQQSLEQLVRERTGDKAFRMDIDGVYNCKDAAVMVQAAQEARGAAVGPVDFWPLGAMEFYWLLSRSLLMQQVIATAVADQGQTYEQQYGAAMILVPMAEAPGLTFVGANVPASCAGATPTIGPGNQCMPGFQWDSGAGACMSLTTPQCPTGQVWDPTAQACVPSGAGGISVTGESKERAWWVVPLAVGAGLAVAGGGYYYYTTRK